MIESSAGHQVESNELLGELLAELGASNVESKLFEKLLPLGTRSAGNIARQVGFSRSYTYDLLESLSRKGLIVELSRRGVRHFKCQSRDRLLQGLEQRRHELERKRAILHDILPYLGTRKTRSKADPAKQTAVEFILSAAADDVASILIRSEASTERSDGEHEIGGGVSLKKVSKESVHSAPSSLQEETLTPLKDAVEILVGASAVCIRMQAAGADEQVEHIASPSLANVLGKLHRCLWPEG